MSSTPSSSAVFTVTKAYLIPTDAMSAATCAYGVSTWHLNGTNVSWRDLNILKTLRLYVLELKHYLPPRVNHFIRSYALAEVYYCYTKICVFVKIVYIQGDSPTMLAHFFSFFNSVINHIWKFLRFYVLYFIRSEMQTSVFQMRTPFSTV